MIRFRRRREESLRVVVSLEPPTKRTRAGTKKKAKAVLADAFDHDLLACRARDVTTWPKPRAATALDVHLRSGKRNGARIDHVCKWLLDELAGHVYADDRQVKMLFARVSRSSPPLPSKSVADAVGAEFYAEAERLFADSSDLPPRSDLHITAQTRASVLADLRAVSQLDEDRWDPFDGELGIRRLDTLWASFQREELVEYHATFDTESDTDVRQRRRLNNQIDHHDQSHQQAMVDVVFSSLFTDLPVDRFGIWGRVRHQISYTPYIFDVGVLPRRGESAAFRTRFRTLLEERRAQFPELFPMRARSGISMVLFEAPESGKDVDNLILTMLPDILDVLRPQQRDLAGWVADEVDPSEGTPDIPFIEIAAFPAHLADMPPGSVVFGLSSADRFDSWWSMAADHLERVLDEQEAKGWW